MQAASQVVDLSAYIGPFSTLLNQTLPDGSPGLGPSVFTSNYQGALEAQQAINQQVGVWGDAVAIGSIQIQAGASPQGTNLAPGNTTAYTFLFAVTNRTNQQSVVTFLTAAVLSADTLQPPAGNWPTALPIVDQAVPSATATDPLQLPLTQDVPHMIAVQLLVPAGVATGLNLLIRVTATIGPPSSITSTGDKTGLLTLTAAPNPLTTGFSVSLQRTDGDPKNAMPGAIFNYRFNSQYVPGQGPSTPGQQPPATLANCTLAVTFTGTAFSAWTPSLGAGSQASNGGATLTTAFFPLPAPGNAGVQLTILELIPPNRTTTDQTISFTVLLQASYTDAQGNQHTLKDNANGQTFTATVTHS